MMYFMIFLILIGVTEIAYAQSQDIVPYEKDFVPYTENYNVRFDSDGRIDYDFLIAKIMPEIFEKKLHTLGVNVSSEDIVLDRGPRILMYQPQSYNCGYAIDHEKNKVYWLEAAINSTHIEYANIREQVPRDADFEPEYADCFSPLEIKVAEIFLQEKTYFTPEEEARAAASVKHYLRGNENLNTYQFKIGKFNFDYKNEDVLSFCGKFEGRKIGTDYFSGILKSGNLSFGLETSMSSLCAIKEDAKLYDIKFQRKSDPDKSLQGWKNNRLETVYLKPISIEKLLERNYLYADFINNMIFAYSSHLKPDYVDYQPENSSTVLKFTPFETGSYMKIRLPDSGAHYYMTYGSEEWHEGNLLGISILIDGKKTVYSQFSYVESPDAPYPQYYTDLVFKVPANSTNVEVKLDIEDYNFNAKESEGEWRDYQIRK